MTDARYFAAMGVDWMSIELNNDPASFMRWHTLKDWVSGVKMAAEIIVPDEMLIAKTIIDAKPDGIVFHHPDYQKDYRTSNCFLMSLVMTMKNFKEVTSGYIHLEALTENYS